MPPASWARCEHAQRWSSLANRRSRFGTRRPASSGFSKCGETHEEADRFKGERLIPAIEQGPENPDNTAPPNRDSSYQLHNLVRGT